MAPVATRAWGPPDSHGVRTSYTSPARVDRHRRGDESRRSVATLLGERRTLVVAWLKGGGAGLRAKTLLGKAGGAQLAALEAIEYLVEYGWAEVNEKRPRADWKISSLTWLDADALREALGLPRRDTQLAHRDDMLSRQPTDPRLSELHTSLSALATPTLGRRAKIVSALDEWCLAERSGSRNLFAHVALDDTHGMTTGDWQWIERHVDPESLGISRHTPAVWLRGPIRLGFGAAELDIGVVPDMIALSPATLVAADRMEGKALAWLVVENRTSFETVARAVGDRYLVLWMPGFVPDWWLDAIRHAAGLMRIPAHIAADPDPAGIEIALRAGNAWQGRWAPWAMSAAALAATGKGKPLNDYDRQRLATLDRTSLSAPLRELADALEKRERKGEQEALNLIEWLGTSLTVTSPQ